jgi:hypothetical protein
MRSSILKEKGGKLNVSATDFYVLHLCNWLDRRVTHVACTSIFASLLASGVASKCGPVCAAVKYAAPLYACTLQVA